MICEFIFYKFVTIGEVYMKVNIGTYSFGGIASYLGLGPTLLDNSAKCYSQLDCGWAQNGGNASMPCGVTGRTHLPEYMCRCIKMRRIGSSI